MVNRLMVAKKTRSSHSLTLRLFTVECRSAFYQLSSLFFRPGRCVVFLVLAAQACLLWCKPHLAGVGPHRCASSLDSHPSSRSAWRERTSTTAPPITKTDVDDTLTASSSSRRYGSDSSGPGHWHQEHALARPTLTTGTSS
jgi:hypothetical protein